MEPGHLHNEVAAASKKIEDESNGEAREAPTLANQELATTLSKKIKETEDEMEIDVATDAKPKDMQPKLYESLRLYKTKFRNEEFDEKGRPRVFVRAARAVRLAVVDVFAAFYIYGVHTINFEAFLVVLNAVLVTFFYLEYRDSEGNALAAKLDFSILSFAVVFPLTFLMQQAFTRREQALVNMADMKALVVQASMANLTWDFPSGLNSKGWGGRATLPPSFNERVRATSSEFLHLLYQYLSMPTVSRARNFIVPSYKHEAAKVHSLQDKIISRITEVFREFFDIVETLKAHGLPANEASRINQYHWFIQQRLELLRMKKYYRTPQATRSYGRVYVFVLPWFFGPYFAWVAGLEDPTSQTQASYGFALALAALTFLVLMGLINVGRLLEDPFMESDGFDCLHLKAEVASACRAIQYFYEQAELKRAGLEGDSGFSPCEAAQTPQCQL